MQRVQALIDPCGTTSIILAPRLLKRHGISHEVALITTTGLNRWVMEHLKDIRKTQITVQDLDNLTPLDESDVLVVPMPVYEFATAEEPDQPWLGMVVTRTRH